MVRRSRADRDPVVPDIYCPLRAVCRGSALSVFAQPVGESGTPHVAQSANARGSPGRQRARGGPGPGLDAPAPPRGCRRHRPGVPSPNAGCRVRPLALHDASVASPAGGPARGSTGLPCVSSGSEPLALPAPGRPSGGRWPWVPPTPACGPAGHHAESCDSPASVVSLWAEPGHVAHPQIKLSVSPHVRATLCRTRNGTHTL